jgi:hypothetical protein
VGNGDRVCVAWHLCATGLSSCAPGTRGTVEERVEKGCHALTAALLNVPRGSGSYLHEKHVRFRRKLEILPEISITLEARIICTMYADLRKHTPLRNTSRQKSIIPPKEYGVETKWIPPPEPMERKPMIGRRQPMGPETRCRRGTLVCRSLEHCSVFPPGATFVNVGFAFFFLSEIGGKPCTALNSSVNNRVYKSLRSKE